MGWSSDPTFVTLSQIVVNAEGKYSNDPNDPGGPTMWGIAWNYNQEILTRMGITKDTMQNLTLSQAKEVYYQKYWLPSHGPLIKDPVLAYMHFDTAVNEGVGTAANFFHQTANLPLHKQLWAYFRLRLMAYDNDRNQAKYLKGWIKRLADDIQVFLPWMTN